jgi:hypothetical protein
VVVVVVVIGNPRQTGHEKTDVYELDRVRGLGLCKPRSAKESCLSYGGFDYDHDYDHDYDNDNDRG